MRAVWVEATAPSGAVRDIIFEIEYAGLKDIVKATGVWATYTSLKNQNADVTWPDMKANALNLFVAQLHRFGLSTEGPPVGVQNEIGIEFTVAPPNIGSEPDVKFDVTRQVESRYWAVDIIDGMPVHELLSLSKDFPMGDTPNDDANNTDDDNTPRMTIFTQLMGLV